MQKLYLNVGIFMHQVKLTLSSHFSRNFFKVTLRTTWDFIQDWLRVVFFFWQVETTHLSFLNSSLDTELPGSPLQTPHQKDDEFWENSKWAKEALKVLSFTCDASDLGGWGRRIPTHETLSLKKKILRNIRHILLKQGWSVENPKAWLSYFLICK